MGSNANPYVPLLLVLLFSLFAGIATADDDKSAMEDLVGALSPAPAGWSSGTDYCNWSGVNCDRNKRVRSINLASKSLSGTLPQSLNSLSQLTSLSLQNNHLSGPLPSFANLSLLQSLYLDSNNFSSVPPNAFAGLTSLQTLSLSDNFNLSPWPFPSELVDSSSIVTIYASNVNLFGSIPDIFGSFPGLRNLRLSYNNLTGSLPGSFNQSSLQNVWVNNQNSGLTGSLEVLSGMNQLFQVWLHANKFTGPIPDLSGCTHIFDLQLRDNQLTGLVPLSLGSLPKLANLTLQNNKLQGPLPQFPNNLKVNIGSSTNSFCKDVPGDCDPQVMTLLQIAAAFGYPLKLAEVWTGNNACDRWRFVACDISGHVISVNFGKQGFSGYISSAFANLTQLKELNLNDNNLTGIIPQSLTSLTQLKKIDVSNNNISGKVPDFRPGVSVITDGNKYIGIDVPVAGGSPGSGSNSLSPNLSSGSKSSSIPAGKIVGLVFASLVFIGAALIVSFKFYMRKKHRRFGKLQNLEAGNEAVKNDTMGGMNNYSGAQSESHSRSSNDHSEFAVPFEGGNLAISIKVLREVTNNFSEENILGRGGFGVVYKGELHDGTKIAVKRMESSTMGTKGTNEFDAEISVLTKVRHRHLVALLSFCVDGNERLLVYECMPKGHLGQHLFDWQELGYPPLTWKQRVTIALDVARGVEYLHSLAQSSFIHRDLKPSNILLTADMRAKVADFGLVKSTPDGKYSVETRLAGTFGYLAPEYAATGRVTTKVDVYAFGVILMELITGKKALDDRMPDESCHLVTWFRRILINKEDNIRHAIDNTLDHDEDEETYESICRVAELAGHCTTREPHQRPDMGHVVNVLSPLVELWKPSSLENQDS